MARYLKIQKLSKTGAHTTTNEEEEDHDGSNMGRPISKHFYRLKTAEKKSQFETAGVPTRWRSITGDLTQSLAYEGHSKTSDKQEIMISSKYY